MLKLSILVFKNLIFLKDPKAYLRITAVIHLDFENYYLIATIFYYTIQETLGWECNFCYMWCCFRDSRPLSADVKS